MNNLTEHYSRLLGLDNSWRVADVELDLSAQRVEIRLERTPGSTCHCPECGTAGPLKDHAPERQWRHLDTMQFETILSARVPRTRCPDCGVLNIDVPWAEPHGRFSLMFEAFAVRVLQAAPSIEEGRKLLGISWNAAQQIMTSAVERGLASRDLDEIPQVGIDEKNFGKGHDYVSVMTDIDGGRDLEVAPGRAREAADFLWKTFSKEQKEDVEAVAIDMWPAFLGSAAERGPGLRRRGGHGRSALGAGRSPGYREGLGRLRRIDGHDQRLRPCPLRQLR